MNHAETSCKSQDIGGFFPALVLARSYNSSNTNGGVAYANANNDASNSNTNIGSRLIFRRKIFFIAAPGPDVSRIRSAGR